MRCLSGPFESGLSKRPSNKIRLKKAVPDGCNQASELHVRVLSRYVACATAVVFHRTSSGTLNAMLVLLRAAMLVLGEKDLP